MGHQPPAARGRAARAGDARVHGLSPAHRGTRRLRGAGRSTAPVHVGLRRDRRAARRLAERALRPLDRDVYRSRLRGPSALVPRGLRRGRGRRLRGGTAPDAGGVPREQPVRARVLGGGLALRTLSPIAEDSPRPPEPVRWPSVAVVVPARNEARFLPHTLPSLLGQDYPGPFQVIVVDDRSSDGTGEVAFTLGAEVVHGLPLPAGWVGKVWALEQGARAAGRVDYLLLADADIRHVPASLRLLVAESEAQGLALNSRMARLHCSTRAERLLIPPYLFFFNLLYPPRRVNDPWSRRAAAAGGCVLLRRGAGSFESIRGEVIDDVSLARRVKRAGGRIRLAVSRSDVVSLREHSTVASIRRMVARTAFAQLRRSHALVALTLLALVTAAVVPPIWLAL